MLYTQPVKFNTTLVVILLILIVMTPASAQTGGQALLAAPDLSKFPSVLLHFDVYDSVGAYDTNLTETNVTVLEDDQPIKLSNLTLESPGVNFVVAYNTGPTLANRYAGNSRFDLMQAKLLEWAASQPEDTPDRFSLSSNTGMQAVESPNPMDWTRAMVDFKPDLLAAIPSLTSINQAMDMVSAANSGRKRVILFITPTASDMQLKGISDLAARAVQMDVRVHVWQVGPADTAETEGGLALRNMAETTGGSYLTFSGAESLPDVDSYLEPLRYHYTASYRSAIQSSGEHTIQLQVNQGDSQLFTAIHTVSFTLEPPNPMFMSPPSHITRSWVTPEGGQQALTPDSVEISYLIEYTDGHPRSLTSARLFADGKLVQERVMPPFESFDWSLTAYTTSAVHELQIEVVDSQGLKANSILLPVQVDVEEAPVSMTRKFVRDLTGKDALILAVVLVGGVVLYTGTRLGIRALKSRGHLRKKPANSQVQIANRRGASWQRLTDGTPVPARLVRLHPETLEPLGQGDIPLLQRSINLGSAEVDDPSVSLKHARIWADGEGRFMVADAGSVAGTWVNLAPVEREGTPMQHGDVINFGRAVFRFEALKPVERVIKVEII